MTAGTIGWILLIWLVILVDAVAYFVGSQSMSEALAACLKTWLRWPLIIGWTVLTYHLFLDLFR